MKKQFTLIELLVCITIIAILAALLLPTLARAKVSAQRVICISNQKSMGLAALLYQEEYNGHLLRGGGGSDYGYLGCGSNYGFTMYRIATYLPGGDGVTVRTSNMDSVFKANPIYQCPCYPYLPGHSLKNRPLHYIVNSLNFRYFAYMKDASPSNSNGWFTEAGMCYRKNPDLCKRETRIMYNTLEDPSRTILFGEHNPMLMPTRTNQHYGNANFWSKGDLPWAINRYGKLTGAPNTNYSTARLLNVLNNQHLQSMTMAAFDGSAHVLNLRDPEDWQLGVLGGQF